MSKSSECTVSLTTEDVQEFDILLMEESEENDRARRSFLKGLSTGSAQYRLKFEEYLRSAETSRLFSVRDDFLAVRIMNMFL